MKAAIRVGLIGDWDDSVTAHRAIPQALALVGGEVGVAVAPVWLATTDIDRVFERDVMTCDALWCIPASPYADTAAALRAIQFARTSRTPFLGTCGGFQHAVLEYARDVWQMADAAHAELDPGAANAVIAPLECAMVEKEGGVRFAQGSRVAAAYGADHAVEGYHCRYGISPRVAPRFVGGAFHATGWDYSGDVRVLELDGHPFFVATLFQPERAALAGRVPAIVRALVQAACDHDLEQA